MAFERRMPKPLRASEGRLAAWTVTAAGPATLAVR